MVFSTLVFLLFVVTSYLRFTNACDQTNQCSCDGSIMDCLQSTSKVKLKDVPGDITTIKIKLNHIDEEFINIDFVNITSLKLQDGDLMYNMFANMPNVHQVELRNVTVPLNNSNVFKSLSKLDEVALTNIDVSTIAPILFNNIQNLTWLTLTNVTNLQKKTFTSFKAINRLWLHDTIIPAHPIFSNITITNMWLRSITIRENDVFYNDNLFGVLLLGIKNLIILDITGMNITIDKNTFNENRDLEKLFIDESIQITVRENAFEKLHKLRQLKLNSLYNTILLDRSSMKGLSYTVEGVMIRHTFDIVCNCQILTSLRIMRQQNENITIYGECINGSKEKIKLSEINDTDTCSNSSCNSQLSYPICFNEMQLTTNTSNSTTQSILILTGIGTENATLICDEKKCQGRSIDGFPEKQTISLKLILGVVAALCVLLVTGSFVLWYCAKTRRHRKQTTNKDQREGYDQDSYERRIETTHADRYSLNQASVSITSAGPSHYEIHEECSYQNTFSNPEITCFDDTTKKLSDSVLTPGRFFYVTAEKQQKITHNDLCVPSQHNDLCVPSQHSQIKINSEETNHYVFENSDIESEFGLHHPDEADEYADVSSNCTDSYVEVGTSCEQRNKAIFNYLNSRIVRVFPDDLNVVNDQTEEMTSNERGDKEIYQNLGAYDNQSKVTEQFEKVHENDKSLPYTSYDEMYENLTQNHEDDYVNVFSRNKEERSLDDTKENIIDSCSGNFCTRINHGYLNTDEEGDVNLFESTFRL